MKNSSIQMGDLIIVEKNQCIPVGMIYPRTSGFCFLQTDQLNGETDWKLEIPVACTQRLPTATDLLQVHWYTYAGVKYQI